MKQVKDFILWMRKERISCTSLTVGNVTIDGFADGKRVEARPEKAEPKLSIFEQYAGPLAQMPATPTDEVPDESKID